MGKVIHGWECNMVQTDVLGNSSAIPKKVIQVYHVTQQFPCQGLDTQEN
jgi:hypothetical protein